MMKGGNWTRVEREMFLKNLTDYRLERRGKPKNEWGECGAVGPGGRSVQKIIV